MSATAPFPPDPRTVSLADEEGVTQVLVGTVLGLGEIVNNLTDCAPRRRPTRPSP